MQAPTDDPYLWLEKRDSPAALTWVKKHNEASLAQLTGDRRYRRVEKEIHDVFLAPDRVRAPVLFGGMIYNFWQDSEHVRGIWQRTSLSEYRKKNPRWETLLDVDALAKQESESWVYEDADCLAPENRRCLIALSRGGGDKVVRREFDLEKKAFVSDGFTVPEAKSNADWLDANTLLVATDWGAGSLTTSGYPRILKRWSRGTPLASATTVFEGQPSDESVSPWVVQRPEGTVALAVRRPTFFTKEFWLIKGEGKLVRLATPKNVWGTGIFQNRLFLKLRDDWTIGEKNFTSGSVVSIDLAEAENPRPALVFAPDARTAVQDATFTRDRLLLQVLDNVNGRIYVGTPPSEAGGSWKLERLPLPDAGATSVFSANAFDHSYITYFESFLTPETYYLHSDQAGAEAPERLKQAKIRFDASRMVVEQLESKSLDGTRIPYFLIHQKSMKRDGRTPTILEAYGGFEDSQTPFYLGYIGKSWVEHGGAYVLANIRGGGEFGPRWHESVLKENRHKVFEDFISIAEDLIARKITSPRHLGSKGASNGGLLVGATFIARPDLFNAVSCKVPLLDMLRYTSIGAGASWIDEYGDPSDPAMAAVILKYSPYQNVQAGVRYPKIYFSTSTSDDRVEPAHARKMAAKMEAQGHDVLFFESTDGGHRATADLDQKVRDRALIVTYFIRQLF